MAPGPFTAVASATLDGPRWLKERRRLAFEELATMPMPSEKEEVWRYTPIDELRLDDFGPAGAGDAGAASGTRAAAPADAFVEGVVGDIPEHSTLVVVRDGWNPTVTRSGQAAVSAPGRAVRVGGPELLGDDGSALGSVVRGGDLLVRLNDAFHPGVVVVDVPDGVVLDAPVLIVHWSSSTPGDEQAGGPPVRGRATFPRTFVRVGKDASAGIVEIAGGAVGARRSLVAPVTELEAGDGSQLSYVALQVLGTGAWHLARIGAVAGRDATLRTFTVGLGGAYDRSRTDAVAQGQGASTELRSAYLGTGAQVHDVRTLQDHAAPRTTSDLLCKGAVAGTSRSVYSGLIRVRRGAVRTDAYQTNHNLVLDPRAHADSVPNLDIEENDVRCSHASTVGPVDEDQLYYLESRGIPPERAERLIVLGFFEDIIRRTPVRQAAGRLRREVALRLGEALADESLVRRALGDRAIAEDLVGG